MFATSEFTGLPARSAILPARSVPHRETTGMRTAPAPRKRVPGPTVRGELLGFVVRRAYLGGDPSPLADLVAVLLGPGPDVRGVGRRAPTAPRAARATPPAGDPAARADVGGQGVAQLGGILLGQVDLVRRSV